MSAYVPACVFFTSIALLMCVHVELWLLLWPLRLETCVYPTVFQYCFLSLLPHLFSCCIAYPDSCLFCPSPYTFILHACTYSHSHTCLSCFNNCITFPTFLDDILDTVYTQSYTHAEETVFLFYLGPFPALQEVLTLESICSRSQLIA